MLTPCVDPFRLASRTSTVSKPRAVPMYSEEDVRAARASLSTFTDDRSTAIGVRACSGSGLVAGVRRLPDDVMFLHSFGDARDQERVYPGRTG